MPKEYRYETAMDAPETKRFLADIDKQHAKLRPSTYGYDEIVTNRKARIETYIYAWQSNQFQATSAAVQQVCDRIVDEYVRLVDKEEERDSVEQQKENERLEREYAKQQLTAQREIEKQERQKIQQDRQQQMAEDRAERQRLQQEREDEKQSVRQAKEQAERDEQERWRLRPFKL